MRNAAKLKISTIIYNNNKKITEKEATKKNVKILFFSSTNEF